MKTLKFHFLLLPLFLLGMSGCENIQQNDPPQEAASPNVLIFFVDDLGMISTPAYPGAEGRVWVDTTLDQGGVPYKTPHLDAFASEAKRFDYMYATPSCAPSRAEFMTGRYQFRTGIVFPAYCGNSPATELDPNGYLAEDEITFAKIAQNMGYKTAFGGKWNLRYGIGSNKADRMNQPPNSCSYDQIVGTQQAHLIAHGFQETYGPNALIGNMIDYYPPQYEANNGYYPDSLNAWMQNWVVQNQDLDKPFLLHYCFGLIHDSSDPEFEPGAAPTPNNPSAYLHPDSVFADKMEYVDAMIGNVLSVIDQNQKLYENTVVFIIGDNGTEDNYYCEFEGQQVQGGKLTFNTCGSRVPFMVRWPKVIQPGATSELYEFADVFSTLVDLVGGTDTLKSITAGQSYPIDGNSFLNTLTDGKYGSPQAPREAVYCQLQAAAFVADKEYQYRTGDMTTFELGDTGLYYVGNSPLPDSLILPDKNGGYSNPKDEAAYQKLTGIYESLGVTLRSNDANPDSCGVCGD